MNRIFVAGYHQSPFGKLYDLNVADMVRRAVEGVCGETGITPAQVDVATIGATCHISLNRQGLLSGLLAEVDGLSGKPIESVENACASGGQAILSVAQKLQLGMGEVGLAVGYEKMRDDAGKMDGASIGEALGYFSHPAERPGKTYVFPHIFAEIMAEYMSVHGVSESDLARIVVQEYANARHNPYAQMRDTEMTLEKALRIEGINRYIVDGLPLKTFDSSQISDGYASLLLATERGLDRMGMQASDTVELAGYGQATDALSRGGRNVLKPAGALRAMQEAYRRAEISPGDVQVAEVHDCFSVMGAIGAEVLGVAKYGQGARYWSDGHAAVDGRCPINTSGGLIAKGHPIGATGIAMVGWCFWQLLGKAPEKLQVPGANIGATFNIGGPICASVCTVLKAVS